MSVEAQRQIALAARSCAIRVGGIAEARQDRVGVRAERRHAAPFAALASSSAPGGSSAGIFPAGESTSLQRWRARSCGCSHTSFMSLTCALAICASSRRPTTSSAVSLANSSTMSARNSSRAALRFELVEKRAIGGERGLLQHLVAERRPFALVLQTEHHGLAVAGGKRPVRIDGGVARAGARRRRRAVEGVVERIAHPLDQRLEHRDVEVLPAAGLPRSSSAARMLVYAYMPAAMSAIEQPRLRGLVFGVRSPTGSRPRSGSAGRRPSCRDTGRRRRSRRCRRR